MKTIVCTTESRQAIEGGLLMAQGQIWEGEVICFPIAHTYVLAARAKREDGVQNLFELAGKREQPPVILVGNADWAEKVGEVNTTAKKLMELWPRPLALKLQRKPERINDALSFGTEEVVVMVPQEESLREFLSRIGPVAVYPANLPGEPLPLEAADVMEHFCSKIHTIMNYGSCDAAKAPTVVDARTETPVILEQGCISEEEIMK